MATTIKVAGKDLKLAYTLHTAVSYEKMTGKNALDLEPFKRGELEPIALLGYCMVNSANPKDDVPELPDFLNAFTTNEQMLELVAKIVAELTAFFKPTEADKAEKQEDAGKNE